MNDSNAIRKVLIESLNQQVDKLMELNKRIKEIEEEIHARKKRE